MDLDRRQCALGPGELGERLELVEGNLERAPGVLVLALEPDEHPPGAHAERGE